MDTNPTPSTSTAQPIASDSDWTTHQSSAQDPREEWVVDLHTRRVVRGHRSRTLGKARREGTSRP